MLAPMTVSQGKTLRKRYGHRPQMLQIPEAVLQIPEAVLHAVRDASTAGPSLLFNILAVL